MLELATWAIGAVKFFMEALAELSLIVLGHIGFEVKLFDSMSEGTGIFKRTVACQFPVLAQFCLVFSPEIFLNNWLGCLGFLSRVEEHIIITFVMRFELL
jgi:hypothetical protein